ncbi:MAG: cupin domain-containing protein [Bacteroidia bacterium]
MNLKEYITSGVLESYCLGLVSEQEQFQIEKLAASHPEVQMEIDSIYNSFEQVAAAGAVAPPPAVKNNLMLRIYEMESGVGKKYPPLIKVNSTAKEFSDWLAVNPITNPERDTFENLHTYDLPSTDEVTNFAVWAKQGHDDEEHNDFLEYIVILKGSCDMYMNGVRNHFNEGEIIRIPKDCNHYAVITSEEPMVAIVQRVAA